MTIEMFPAKDGDSLLVRLDNKKNILIDMGYVNTYRNYIKDRLIEIKNDNQCIDLLIITHIDEDHIEGAIEFIKENGDANDPKIIEVKEIWHNSYRHLQFNKVKVDNVSRFEIKQLKEIVLSNSVTVEKEMRELNSISARQGSTLSGYLYGLGYTNNRWNSLFNDEAVNLDRNNEIKLDDVKIYILSPNTKKLNDLSKLWIEKLKKIDIDFSISDEEIFDDAYEMYMKKLKPINDINESNAISYNKENFKTIINDKLQQINRDKSKSNGASISFILEYKDKKFLFLGDAHEDIIVDNLIKYKKSGRTLNFDVVKISHHASIKNNFKWIEIVGSKKYLISTNGKKYGHPSKQVVAKILQYDNNYKTFYFNYPVDICKEMNENILKEKYKYSLLIGNGISSIQIEVNDYDE